MNVRLLDTNILAYAYDESEPAKRSKCLKILEKCWQGEAVFAVSNQILAELFTVLTEKVQRPLSKQDAQKIINHILFFSGFRKIDYTSSTVGSAIELCKKGLNDFWDALIIATMFENDFLEIYTENEKDFNIGGIKVINPFK